ncbi:MAG: AtpZ/AtpI family protein [Planctomycetales bacterium]|nr:AtpZ/AtpI family protein [Planctomycetales bacterium]MCA9169555.1 AtpZ/AtpI family protein [Planctomycetales bacterium]
MSQPPDDRSRSAIAYQWASQIITVSLEMVLPGLAGYAADRRFGTGFVLTIVGFVFGFGLGMKHLLQMTRALDGK